MIRYSIVLFIAIFVSACVNVPQKSVVKTEVTPLDSEGIVLISENLLPPEEVQPQLVEDFNVVFPPSFLEDAKGGDFIIMDDGYILKVTKNFSSKAGGVHTWSSRYKSKIIEVDDEYATADKLVKPKDDEYPEVSRNFSKQE